MRPSLSFWFLALWLSGSLIAGLWVQPSHNLEHALHWGYDAFGRPLSSLVLLASFNSLGLSLAAFLTASFLGALLGTLVEMSGALRPLFLNILELSLSFPTLLLGLTWAALFGSGYDTLYFALTIGSLPSTARFFQLRLMECKNYEYVKAAESLGASSVHIAVRHHFPHLLASYSVKIPNLFSGLLLAEASLSFLGMGAPLGSTTWGTLLAQARDYLIEAPHIAFFSGIPLILCTLSLENLSHRYSKKGVLR